MDPFGIVVLAIAFMALCIIATPFVMMFNVAARAIGKSTRKTAHTFAGKR